MKVLNSTCALCERVYVSNYDALDDTPSFGGAKVPGRLIARWREDHDLHDGKFHLRYKSLAHGQTLVPVCCFCYQFFSYRKFEKNVHDELIEHFNHHTRNGDVPPHQIRRKDGQGYFKVAEAMRSYEVSRDRMIRWNKSMEKGGGVRVPEYERARRGKRRERKRDDPLSPWTSTSTHDDASFDDLDQQMTQLRMRSRQATESNKLMKLAATNWAKKRQEETQDGNDSVFDNSAPILVPPLQIVQVKASPRRPHSAPRERPPGLGMGHTGIEHAVSALVPSRPKSARAHERAQRRESVRSQVRHIAAKERRAEINEAVAKLVEEHEQKRFQHSKHSVLPQRKSQARSRKSMSAKKMRRTYSAPQRPAAKRTARAGPRSDGDSTLRRSKSEQRKTNRIAIALEKTLFLQKKQRKVALQRLKSQKELERRKKSRMVVAQRATAKSTPALSKRPQSARARPVARDGARTKSTSTIATPRTARAGTATPRRATPAEQRIERKRNALTASLQVDPEKALHYLQFYLARKRYGVFLAILRQFKESPYVLHQSFRMLLDVFNTDETGTKKLVKHGIVALVKTALELHGKGNCTCRASAVAIVNSLASSYVQELLGEDLIETILGVLEFLVAPEQSLDISQYVLIVSSLTAILKLKGGSLTGTVTVDLRNASPQNADQKSPEKANYHSGLDERLDRSVRQGALRFPQNVRSEQAAKEFLTWLQLCRP